VPRLIEKTWNDSGHHRLVSSRDRGPFRYQAFIPDAIAELDPSLPASITVIVEGATLACAHLDHSPGIDDLEPVARLLLRAESVASSRIEGLRLSHRRIEEASFEPRAARGTALSIVRNIEAMGRAIELGSAPEALTVDSLLSVHRTLLDTERDRDIAGVVRTDQNWIGGGNTPRRAEFVPPPPEHVDELLDDLVAFSNRNDLPAITQAAIAHAQFETIHPFADGNGRVGRCLVHLILRRRGVSTRVVPPVSVVLAANARLYVDGLTAFRAGDLAGWCRTFADATRIAAERAIDLGSDFARLREEWIERAGNPRRNSSARRLIERLPGHPIVSVESAARLLDTSDEAARLALTQLDNAVVVRQITVGTRNRAWAASEVFDLLDDFDALVATPDAGEGPTRPVPASRPSA
jgi:Fic family protein